MHNPEPYGRSNHSPEPNGHSKNLMGKEPSLKHKEKEIFGRSQIQIARNVHFTSNQTC